MVRGGGGGAGRVELPAVGFRVEELRRRIQGVRFNSPLLSKEGKTDGLRTLTWKPRPESGLDCLICAIFARQRTCTAGRASNRASGSASTCI